MFKVDTILIFLPAAARLYANVLSGIRRRLGTTYQIQIIERPVETETQRKLVKFWEPRGCIVLAAEGLNEISHKAFGRIPVVYLDRTPLTHGNFLDVVQDYEENGRIAARELLHPDIADYAYVGYEIPTTWSMARGRSFAEGVRLQGKVCHVFENDGSSEERPNRLEKWLVELPKPVGIFAANDFTAREILVLCTRNRIAVPREAALLGIDNIADICESTALGISSIASDFHQAGWSCADLLVERLHNPRLRKVLRKYHALGVVRRLSTQYRTSYDARIMHATNVIRARACDDLSVEDVALDMGCSRRMAEIRYRKATGKTIKDAITRVRLERAKVLLKDRSMTFEAIAAQCGYKSESALRIAFRKAFGTPLLAYRNRGSARVAD